MKLIRFGNLNRERPGVILNDERRVDVSSFGEDYDEQFFGNNGLQRLRSWLEADAEGSSSERFRTLPVIPEKVRLGPPICRPGKIVCIGLNYADHARESGLEVPEEPVIFLKSPSAFTGPYDSVLLPRGSRKTDWEIELAVVISQKTSYAKVEGAMDCVAGFVLFNDYSEREYQFKRGGQWVKGKSADSFAPVGPFLVTPDEIPNVTGLRMWLKVNGALKQDSNTSQMIFTIPEIVSSVSQYMTLLPGDVISTGTPAGVGAGAKPPEYLRAGDLVEYGIDGLGTARQKVIDWKNIHD
jgi:2-keto-4-pentenoate hydratase/2-oxohepta-3-ene-1,7-dioic acid hydratase in catechol pathway